MRSLIAESNIYADILNSVRLSAEVRENLLRKHRAITEKINKMNGGKNGSSKNTTRRS